MKHRGPGASLNPAREAARQASRANRPYYIAPMTAAPAGTALTGSANDQSMQVGDWRLSQDEHGNLCGSVGDGPARVILRRDEDEEDQ